MKHEIILAVDTLESDEFIVIDESPFHSKEYRELTKKLHNVFCPQPKQIMPKQMNFKYNDIQMTAHIDVGDAFNAAEKEFLDKHDATSLTEYFDATGATLDIFGTALDMFMLVLNREGTIYYNVNTDEQGCTVLSTRSEGDYNSILESLFPILSRDPMLLFYDTEDFIAVNKEGEIITINNLEIKETIIDQNEGFFTVVFDNDKTLQCCLDSVEVHDGCDEANFQYIAQINELDNGYEDVCKANNEWAVEQGLSVWTKINTFLCNEAKKVGVVITQ